MSEDRAQDMEMEVDLLTLVDEEGVEHEFEIVDSAELDGQEYLALVPVPKDAQEALDDSAELVILKVVVEEEEEILEAIEDEEEFDRVGDFFTERLSDTFDFED